MKKALLLLAALVSLAAFYPVKAEAAGKLVVYSSHPLEFIEPLVKDFEKETGIAIEVVAAGTGELLKRIEAETANPLGDVIWGGSLSSLEPFTKYFEPYKSVNESAVIEGAKNPDGAITSFTLVPSVIMINTDLIGNTKVKGYKDLLQPALKGKIANGDPSRSSSAYEHLVNMLYAMGNGDPDKGWTYVGEFAKNLDGKLLSGSSAVYKGVADGEYVVGLTFEEGAAKYVNSKAPVEIVYMEEGVISKPDGMAVIKGAKNLDNAKTFINYLSGREAQTKIANELNRRSVRKDVPPGAGLLPIEEITLIQDDPAVVNANKHTWLEKFKDLFSSL